MLWLRPDFVDHGEQSFWVWFCAPNRITTDDWADVSVEIVNVERLPNRYLGVERTDADRNGVWKPIG